MRIAKLVLCLVWLTPGWLIGQEDSCCVNFHLVGFQTTY